MTAVPSPATTAPAADGDHAATRLRDLGVWAAVGVLVAIFVAGRVAGLALGPAATTVVLFGWDPALVQQAVRTWGLPAGSVVAYGLLLDLVTFALGLVAVWVLLQPPRSGFRTYVGIVVLLHVAVGGNAPLLLAAALPSLAWMTALTGLGWFGLFSLLAVFPDGRFVPRWTRWTVPAWIAVFLWFLAVPPSTSPPAAPTIALLCLLAIGVIGQVHRFRRHSDAGTRRQTRWVLAMLAARVGLVIIVGLVRLVVPSTAPAAAALVVDVVGIGLSYLVSALLVLSIALAVARYRLFDTDVLVARVVVYATLTVFVLIVYGVVVGLVGLLWPGGGVVLPVLATAAAAVTLVPVRSWLQRRAARLVYGDRAEPYWVVGELGDQLAAAARPEDLVTAVVNTVGPALGLARAEITLQGESSPVATYDDESGSEATRPAPVLTQTFPIEHHGHGVGRLIITPGRTRPLSEEDRDLLRRVADQAGLAVAAAQATAGLRAARDDARAAREEERRRLHRDLHDGLGPTLSSLYQRVELAGRLIDSDPAASRRLLADSGEQIRETVVEIRRLVHALRPPRLDDLGLAEAVRVTCDELTAGDTPLQVHCPEPLPALPALVETTAYRIVQEAVTNIVRHADAEHGLVELLTANGELTIIVSDDGRGLPDEIAYGAGLRSLRERAAEVGGTLALSRGPNGGTVVSAHLPLPDERVQA